jgi:hypothetical protein
MQTVGDRMLDWCTDNKSEIKGIFVKSVMIDVL